MTKGDHDHANCIHSLQTANATTTGTTAPTTTTTTVRVESSPSSPTASTPSEPPTTEPVETSSSNFIIHTLNPAEAANLFNASAQASTEKEERSNNTSQITEETFEDELSLDEVVEAAKKLETTQAPVETTSTTTPTPTTSTTSTSTAVVVEDEEEAAFEFEEETAQI